ncbi:MAG: molecular chaperone HtpG [Bacteroidetes bacterium GWE2_41_25]|nr:MAG: molecular chaperone HtpG [Bacteroidetes bacterium GWA2_40_15]OFY00442.1 MAG: molecular chaperone HtpG [Bacteroidetes bacterium GWE2_41_25]OFY59790.1 MAG: molecular chaperone HtpG [Bacteroidetes bacterium GWF2_41_9]HAM09588.1 molecular chaperone HtpG [Bacteroidales bacterium]HBH83108.1 molecular chaperone HtpG [Bacteroidales bacterium]
MQTGKIGVTTENIFPIIKKFLYSDHEIFLRELISNAVDATQKLRTIASVGDYKEEMGNTTIFVSVDKKKKTIKVSDSGIGMTEEELDKYLNQIAFSSANDFLDKYKEQSNSIIGHFGLGFYSSFMVSDKVEVITKSYQDGAKAVKWTCDGSPEFTIEESEKESRGTDIILHIDKDSKEFLEENRVEQLLKKYCKFLPVEIAFGKEKEWKDGKMVDTGKDKILNNTKPAWTLKPADLKDEDYQKFYRELYPAGEESLFNIHLNVDYPFKLTGILYFPKIRSNIEIQKNKIQLYCNQVFVTDSVEGIVPEFLTLLHGVLDSPDIPLNVSRSYLQSDSNVKKISSHITKKVADRLNDIFKNNREEFEKKWDNLKLFIEYGMITEEKFYEKVSKFALLKNTEDKFFTYEEYEKIIKENQTDKNKTLIYLYSTNKTDQYTYIEKAKSKGYDVLHLDGQLDVHLINHLETKLKDSRFVRVDSDVIEKIIQKEESRESKLSADKQDDLKSVFNVKSKSRDIFNVVFETLDETESPVTITQSEFMRRMKEMSQMGGGMNFYGELPDSYNLVVNPNHKLVIGISDDLYAVKSTELSAKDTERKRLREEIDFMEKEHKEKKSEEISQVEKDDLEKLRKELSDIENARKEILESYGSGNKVVKQLIDLAMLANNMLRGEELSTFVKRSVDLL